MALDYRGEFFRGWGFITGSVGEIINIVSWLVVLLYIVFILLDYDQDIVWVPAYDTAK